MPTQADIRNYIGPANNNVQSTSQVINLADSVHSEFVRQVMEQFIEEFVSHCESMDKASYYLALEANETTIGFVPCFNLMLVLSLNTVVLSHKYEFLRQASKILSRVRLKPPIETDVDIE